MLDCGGIAEANDPAAKLKTEISLKAMTMMGYDAINLAGRELNLGMPFFANLMAGKPAVMTSVNVLEKDAPPVWAKAYIVKEVAGIRVAICGLMPPDLLPLADRPEDVAIAPIRERMELLLPEMRKDADMVILLAPMSIFQLRSPLDDLSGKVDLIITTESRPAGGAGAIGETPVLNAQEKGVTLGQAEISVAKTGKVTVHKSLLVDLDETKISDDAVVKLVDDAIAAEERDRAARKKEEEHRLLMEGLKLSPEEFLRRLRESEKPPVQPATESSPDCGD